jgi:putative addiction module component (TIGR02574 family)
MSDAVSKLMPTLEALSPKDKAFVARRMLEMIEEEDEEALFVAELNRRVEESRSGKVKPIPAEEVHRRLRETYG